MLNDLRRGRGLSAEQARRVRENLGLVGVHLRRHARLWRGGRRGADWDDLFQEGCLGLLEAAARFDPEAGIPFAAYALPRIRRAVSQALRTGFGSRRRPRSRPGQSPGTGAQGAASMIAEGPNLVPLTEELQRTLAAAAERPEAHGAETVGERVRHLFEQAVRAAGEHLAGRATCREDRRRLLDLLIHERLLLPQEEARRPLRQIARDTGSSYARVAQCETQLVARVRELLEADPEFCELVRRLRTRPAGGDRPIDAELERHLCATAEEELMRRFRNADPSRRSQWVHELFRTAYGDLEPVVRAHVARLPANEKRRLLQFQTPMPRDGDSRRPASRQARRRRRADPTSPAPSAPLTRETH
ncbi:MAG: sigma-70 family RNA polymerase sigma factor [Planctomycetes bacterium]|nr:sigma-70 family RNA polymerase sigma factor [Planctomycetota bacterium]